MLTPDQLSAVAQSHGLTVTQPAAPQASAAPVGPSAGPSAADAYAKRVGYNQTDSTGPSTMDSLKEIGSDIKNDFNTRNANVGEISGRVNSGQETYLGGLYDKVGQEAGMLSDAAMDVIKPAIKPEVKQGIKDTVKVAMQTPAAQGLAKAWANFKAEHPDVASHLEATGNLASLIPTLGGEGAAVKGGAKGLEEGAVAAADTAKGALGSAKDVISKIKPAAMDMLPKGTVEDTIKALDPDLTGKKAVDAYKQVALGNRESVKGGIITGQGLEPSAEAAKIGDRLHSAGIELGSRPLDNLNKISSAFDDTEKRIGEVLKGDSEVVYDADKATLSKSLEDIRTKAPRETATIKDSKKAFNDVVDFAQQLLTKGDDTVAGLRDTRINFDAQARREYPNAFKNGVIDTKSPAGQAIKQVRDTINEHLYNTAPEGSELRTLIQREADLYRASEFIAPKAAAMHGKTVVGQFMVNHPLIGKVLKIGAQGAGLGAGIHLIP